MRIEYVVPCRYAEVHDALATIVGGGIDTFRVSEFPTPIQVMLAVRIVGVDEEFPGSHRVRCPVRDGDDNIVAEDLDATIDLPADLPASGAGEGWLRNIMLSIGVAFVAEAAGTYTLHVMFDDAEYPVPLYVTGP